MGPGSATSRDETLKIPLFLEVTDRSLSMREHKSERFVFGYVLLSASA
uniref:Uncharacterized protein n=1 Tax=Candidatus Kentrum sp. SD TaxID=2126332 RepID=A0A450YC80_9GAMM|nr:MAG: hypothetical protein BECKSD772F_GA0070984_103319 [Candidatus Kentron sp. SD]VFK44642.1 MAG: hypothetical protein BECKSD772E_GA0070983_104116 [Candidatus Kentron sp. SD]